MLTAIPKMGVLKNMQKCKKKKKKSKENTSQVELFK